MFTESVMIGCNFTVCHGGSAKYKTCLIFHRSSLTLDPNRGSVYLETDLS